MKQKNLTIENPNLGFLFTFENIGSDTTTKAVWVKLQEFFEVNAVPTKNRFGLSSFTKMMKEFNIVKGWTITVSTPTVEGYQAKARKAVERDEKRLSKKARKREQRKSKPLREPSMAVNKPFTQPSVIARAVRQFIG